MIKKVITIIIILLIIVLFSASVSTMHNLIDGIIELNHHFINKIKETKLPELFRIISNRNPVTVLFYGIDSGEWPGETYREGQGRADTIALLKIYPERRQASLLSIPRDTMVEIPGRRGQDKFGHAYAYGGAEMLVDTVEHFCGLEIDHYIGINYVAFKEIVDVLGGVEFEVDRVIEARGLRLEPGLQVLDGDQAFALVSFRKESLGDIGRVMRQQRFMLALLNEAREKPLRSVLMVFWAFWNNVDTDIELCELADLALKGRGIEEEDVNMDIVPGSFYNYKERSYWKPDMDQNKEMIRVYFHEE